MYCASIHKYTGVYRSIQKYARVCKSIQEYARVCKSIQEYAGVYKSMREYTGLTVLFVSWPCPQTRGLVPSPTISSYPARHLLEEHHMVTMCTSVSWALLTFHKHQVLIKKLKHVFSIPHRKTAPLLYKDEDTHQHQIKQSWWSGDRWTFVDQLLLSPQWW